MHSSTRRRCRRRRSRDVVEAPLLIQSPPSPTSARPVPAAPLILPATSRFQQLLSMLYPQVKAQQKRLSIMSFCEKRFPSVSAPRAIISFSSACRNEDRRRGVVEAAAPSWTPSTSSFASS
eukprot:1135385-Pyramimonas_sp.AAC.1